MPIRGPSAANGQASVGDAAKRVADHAKALAGLEVELAAAEMRRKAASLGVGIGLLAGGALLAAYAVGFLLATVAAALALAVDLWLALLIVGLVLVLVTGLLAWLGVRSVQRAAPPLPEQAITEARLTSEAIKS
jgi:Putative Actinobacterial Holin-X, holin superfamily III